MNKQTSILATRVYFTPPVSVDSYARLGVVLDCIEYKNVFRIYRHPWRKAEGAGIQSHACRYRRLPLLPYDWSTRNSLIYLLSTIRWLPHQNHVFPTLNSTPSAETNPLQPSSISANDRSPTNPRFHPQAVVKLACIAAAVVLSAQAKDPAAPSCRAAAFPATGNTALLRQEIE